MPRAKIFRDVGPLALTLFFEVYLSLTAAAAESTAWEPDGLKLSAADAGVTVACRLFFETRFAQYFVAHCNGEVNAPLEKGDQLVDVVRAIDRPPLPGPFRGQSVSCRQCHFGDDFIRNKPLTGGTYCDFNPRRRMPS